MDHAFPFGFDAPTAGYLILYVTTFALHQAFVHYVVAGSLYVTWAMISPGRQRHPRAAQPLAATLRDWLPFGLGAAITAGVAPLLFVQILYPRGFYTANLLLAWRWLIVIPVLGAAFYLLYLLKSERLSRWRPWAQCAVAVVTTACLLFVGFCWTSNHLLSIREASWPEVYAGGSLPRTAAEVLGRLLVWLGGAFMTMSAVVAWQLCLRPRSATDELAQPMETRRLALLSFGGAGLALAGGALCAWQSAEWSDAIRTRLARPYLMAALFGGALQASAWLWQLRIGRLRRAPLVAASVGAALALLGVSVLREVIRVKTVDFAALYEHHAEAAKIGGLTIFILFTVVNIGLIGVCIWLVRRGVRYPLVAVPSKGDDERQAQATSKPRSVTV